MKASTIEFLKDVYGGTFEENVKTVLPKAKLAQKLRWRKATKSNFCDKVFIDFENHVRRYYNIATRSCFPNTDATFCKVDNRISSE